MTQNEEDRKYKAQPLIYWLGTPLWLIAVISLGWLTWEQGETFEELELTRQAIIFTLIIWFPISIRQLDIDEIAAVTCLGWPVMNIGPGLGFFPRFLFRLHRFTRTVEQKQFPGNPEEIFGGDDKESLPKDMVRALRIVTGKPTSTTSHDPLNIQMTLEFVYFLRIQIDDPLVFLIEYGSIERFWDQIRDTGDRILTRKVSAKPGVSALIADISNLMKQMRKRFEKVCHKNGVRIVETGLNSPNISHTLAVAIRDVGTVKAKAGAEKERLIREGEGRAKAEGALIREIDKELRDADAQTVATYMGKTVLSDKTTVIGAEGISQLFALGGLITTSNDGGGKQ